jgi:hypothetical protein
MRICSTRYLFFPKNSPRATLLIPLSCTRYSAIYLGSSLISPLATKYCIEFSGCFEKLIINFSTSRCSLVYSSMLFSCCLSRGGISYGYVRPIDSRWGRLLTVAVLLHLILFSMLLIFIFWSCLLRADYARLTVLSILDGSCLGDISISSLSSKMTSSGRLRCWVWTTCVSVITTFWFGFCTWVRIIQSQKSIIYLTI